MSEFNKCIKDIADIFDGPHATPEKTASGPYYLSISSLNKGRLDLAQSAFLSENDFEKWTKRVTPREGDVLFSYETRLGEAAIMPGEIKACLGRRMGILRPKKDKVLPEYLLYAYLSPQFQQTIISKTIRGATVDRIALNELPNFPIRIPDLSEQRNISYLLSNIDSKIALNNRINAELEAMAKTVYDYWFVQFDFPFNFAQGKPSTEGKPYKSSGGKMVWCEELKREVPEGWEVGTIGDYCPSTGGFAFKSEWWTDKGVSVVKIKDIQENYTIDLNDLAKVDLSDKKVDDKFKAKAGDILIAMTGATVGKYAIVPKTDYPIYVNQRVGFFNLGMEPTKRLPFLINSLNQSYFREAIFTLASGAAQPNISNEQINNIQLIKPMKEIVNLYNSQMESVYQKILNNQQENQQLSSLRDWLLPMLMNGQVVSTSLNNRVSTTINNRKEEGSGLMAAEPGEEYEIKT